ncbi:MAG: RHS repeat-associated core domain-containing protein, partial [Thermoguttaceae bacterium]
VVERYAYTPYGQVQYRDSDWIEYEVQDSAYSNTTLYTGRTLDPATDLYYYRARYYDAALERFVSRDPIGFKGGMNLYGYVGDMPLIATDPSGLITRHDEDAVTINQPPVRKPPKVPTGKQPVSITYVSDRPGVDWMEAWGDFWSWNYDLDDLDCFQPNEVLKKGQCVGSILIIAHGGYSDSAGVQESELTIGNNVVTASNMKGKQLGTGIVDMFKNIVFCKTCSIEIRACEIGQLAGLQAAIAKATGCTVTLHSGKVNIFGNEW